MGDLATTGLVALVLGFLPAAIIALAVVVFVGIMVLFFAFLWLLDQPPSAWLFIASLAFNVVILVPLWVVSWLAANYEPVLWAGSATYVYVFSAVFVLPTALFYLLWQRAIEREKEH